MKRIMQLLVAAGLLGLAAPTHGLSSPHQAPTCLSEQTALIPFALAKKVIDECYVDLNQMTGEQMTAKEWLIKYHNGGLNISQINKSVFRLTCGGSVIIITIDP